MQDQIINFLHTNPSIDVDKEIRWRVNFLKNFLLQSGAKGLVLGISGGIDSTAAGKLCQKAMTELYNEGHEATFYAVRLPYGEQFDAADAELAMDFIEPDERLEVNIKPMVDAIGIPLTQFNKGNLKARARMVVQYAIASEHNALVVGSDHAAEAVMGFFTKFGDGAADIVPLYGLNKRQVIAVLERLGAPEKITRKAPTADLLDDKPGQLDTDELGVSYDAIDDYLEGRIVNDADKEKIEATFLRTVHKRRGPFVPQDFPPVY